MADLLRDRYEPKAELGRGAQGTVLLAFDHQHGREVALKVRPVHSEQDRAALLGEARALLSLRPHPGIPLIRDDFFTDDAYVLVMDFIEGENLAEVLRSRGDPGLAPSVALGYIGQLAGALDHLHRHDPPVVHGDVKPANVILRASGEVVLVDFGIVGVDAPTGTAGYLAPEVASGETRTPAADVYGLAATAVTLLTGAPPTHGRPTWDGVDPNLVGALERGIRRGLAIEPTRRPGSASELVERLRGAFAASLPTGVVTFLFTDIEGSTRLWDAHGDAMGEVIARTEAIIADAVETHRGRLIKSRGEGDSTMSVFPRATDAANAAVAIQLAIAEQTWPEHIELRLRVALHTGQAELREGDYYGPTLNRAARLRGIAVGGQILCSRVTADLVAHELPDDTTLAELGDRELRGLTRNELVYALEHDQLTTAPAIVGVPPVRYADAGGVSIAYQVFGAGSRTVVGIPGFVQNIELLWDEPHARRFFERFASFATLAHFDKRGTGLSDRDLGHPTLEERADEVLAVMDAAGIERAILAGFSEGSTVAVFFAATHPSRVEGLMLAGGMASYIQREDHPWAPTAAEAMERFKVVESVWGQGVVTADFYAPSMSNDEAFRNWAARYERQSLNPSRIHEFAEYVCQLDIRWLLESITVPTVVFHAEGDRITPVESGRYLAEHIPGATFTMVHGEDHALWFGNQDAWLEAIRSFVVSEPPLVEVERELATVLASGVLKSPAAALLGREVATSHRGRIVQSADEGFVATFDGPSRAVRAAIEFVARANSELGVFVGAGLHFGEIERRGDEVAGVAVRLAACVQEHAPPGGVTVSRSVSDLVAGSGLAFVDRGDHEFAGVEGSWRLFDAVAPHPILVANETPRRSLPAPRTSFVGRQAELRSIAGLLRAPQLVTLTGIGGTGKTRLALEAALAWADACDHAVYLCELASLRDALAVPRALAVAVGVLDPLAEASAGDAATAADAVEKQVAAGLQRAHALVVLDNCEHVIERCAELCDALLTTCPGITILATSREPLGIPGEHVFPVPPMAPPEVVDGGDDPAALLEFDAVQLFCDRARATRGEFSLTADNADAVARICRQVAGIPLAVELAAARLSALSVAQIADRLDDAIALLTSGSRTAPDRHRTLGAAMQWSYDLLDADEQTLLRCLAVFVDGWTLEAAEHVFPATGQATSNTVDLLSRLIDKSLVLADDHGDAVRYRLLEPVRQFAEAKLREQAEEDAARRAHRDYYTQFAAGAAFVGHVDYARLPSVVAELANLTAAFEWSQRDRKAVPALALAVNLYGVWRHLGRNPEAGRWLEEALGLADDRPSALTASAMGLLASVYEDRGDLSAAADFYLRALDRHRSRADDNLVGWALTGYARVPFFRGDYDACADAYDEALVLLRKTGDALGAGWALFNYAWMSLSAGRLDVAKQRVDECLDLGASAGREPQLMAKVIEGMHRAILGDVAGGRAVWESGLAGLEGANQVELQWCLMLIGAFEIADGAQQVVGRSYLARALELARTGALVAGVPWLLEFAAQAAAQRGQHHEAARLFGAADAYLREFGINATWQPLQRGLDDARRETERQLADHYASELEAGAALDLASAVDVAIEVVTADAPVTAPQVTRSLVPSAAVGAVADSVFVGRGSELKRIEEIRREAAAGATRAVFIGGEPGVGKTRLASHAALAASIEGATVLFGRCDEDNVVPYQPFVEALDHYAAVCPPGELAAHAGGDADELARLVPNIGRLLDASPSAFEEPDRHRLFAAVTSLLGRAAAVRPIVLVLDDLQWADPPTLLLARHLLHAPPFPLLVIATFRDTDLTAGDALTNLLADLRRESGVERIALSGLDVDRVGDLLRAMTGHDLGRRGERLALRLWRDTEGNPFFVGEFLRHLVETGSVFQRDGAWTFDVAVSSLRVPESIREVVNRRLARLDDDTNATLRAAAVLGRDFDYRVLAAMSVVDDERALIAVEAAIEAQLVVELPDAFQPRYEFTHALVRNTLLDGLALPRRQRLHLRAAEAIIATTGQRPPAGSVAAHYRAAGEAAAAIFAWEDGVAHLDPALAIAEDGNADAGDRARVLERLGNLLYSSGLDHRRGIDLLERALVLYDELGRPERAAVVRSRLGMNLSGRESMDIPRALEHFRSAAAVLASGTDRRSYAYLCIGMATAALRGARIDEGLEACTKGMHIADELGDRGLWAFGASMQAWGLLGGGRLAEGTARLDDAWRAGDETGNASAVFMSSWVASNFFEFIADPVAGLEWAERGLAHPALAKATGQRVILGNSAAVLGFDAGRAAQGQAREAAALEQQNLGYDSMVAALVAGDSARALKLSTRAAEAAALRGDIWNESWLRWCAGRTARRLGDNNAAEGQLTRALVLAAAGGLRLYEAPVAAELASLLAEEGRVDQAREYLATARRIMNEGGDWRGRVCDVDAAAAAIEAAVGKTVEAEATFARVIEGYQARSLPWREADALRAWGRILMRRGETTPGETKLRAASELEAGLRSR